MRSLPGGLSDFALVRQYVWLLVLCGIVRLSRWGKRDRQRDERFGHSLGTRVAYSGIHWCRA